MIKHSAVINTPLGKLSIVTHSEKLIKINFIINDIALQNPRDLFTKKVCDALESYFENPKYKFTLDIETQGTPFQKSIWQALKKIPSGETVTYKDIATLLKTSPRAVGNACRANPIPIIIPCHRVIAQKGLGGFAGDTQGKLLKIKQWLLHHENIILSE